MEKWKDQISNQTQNTTTSSTMTCPRISLANQCSSQHLKTSISSLFRFTMGDLFTSISSTTGRNLQLFCLPECKDPLIKLPMTKEFYQWPWDKIVWALQMIKSIGGRLLLLTRPLPDQCSWLMEVKVLRCCLLIVGNSVVSIISAQVLRFDQTTCDWRSSLWGGSKQHTRNL